MKTEKENKKMKKLLMIVGAAAIAVGATLPAWATDRTWVGGTGTADSPRDINDADNWGGSLSANSDNMLLANEGEYTYLTNTHSSASQTCRVVYFNAGDYSFSGDLTALAVRGGVTGKRASVLKKRGDWKLTNDISLGNTDNTTLVFTNESGNVTGTAKKDGSYIIAQRAGAYAKLVNLDGTVSLDNNLTLASTATSTGVVEMVGGTLETTKIVKGNASGSASILLGGGTLKAKSADTFIPSGIAVTVGEGGGTIDNGGYDITIGASLGGVDDTGRLHLTGSGTTSLGQTLINNGKIVVDSGTVRPSAMHIGENDSNDGLVEVNGGTLSITTDLFMGYNSNAKGTLTINGGMVEVDSASQTLPAWSSGSSGTINLNGGVLKTKRIAHRNGSCTINFNGGTLQANTDSNTDFIKNGITVNVVAGGTIDNGGFAITIPAALSGSGSLTFKGAGTTTLSGSVNNYSGVTRVVAGSTNFVSNTIATKMLSNGLELVGVPELNTPYTILASSSENDDWSSLSLSKVTCPVASEFTKAIGDDGKSIVVTVTSLKSGNVWTGAKDSNMSDPDNWLADVVPADGADIDLSGATTVNGDLNYALGAVTMGSSVVTFTGSFTAASFSDTSKVAVGANSTVTIDGSLSFALSDDNKNICHWVGDGGKFEVTGDIKVTGGSRVLNPCVQSVGTGVVAAKGLVNNAGSDSSFRLVRAIEGYHANWLIGEHGLSGSRQFAVANSAAATAKIIAATDFAMSASVTANKALELDTVGHIVTIASNYGGSGARTFSGTGTVAVGAGVGLGTGDITLGAGTTLALTATSSTFTALTNALNLPTTGAATIRIDGARLSSGSHTIASNVAAGATTNVVLDPAGTALGGRKASLRVEDGSLVLRIEPCGMILSVY